MKVKICILFSALLFSITAIAQDQEAYNTLTDEAYKLYKAKKFSESAQKYKEAFDQINRKAFPNDRYNAACSYALANEKDSAFYHLFRLANSASKYRNHSHITSDIDLESLHKDARWNELMVIVLANKQEAEKDLDQELIAILDEIYVEDQKYRKQLGKIEKKHGRKSDKMTAHWKMINEKDSINLIKVKKILDERGWLGPKIIGGQGNSTLFLVIQHSDLETQLQYLPMMREAQKKGNARSSSLALLEDRVALRQGKRQIYGSQIGRDPDTGEYYVSPLVDPENVDTRRAEMSLGPIDNYCQNWDFHWNVEKHMERTKMLENTKE